MGSHQRLLFFFAGSATIFIFIYIPSNLPLVNEGYKYSVNLGCRFFVRIKALVQLVPPEKFALFEGEIPLFRE